MYSIKSILGDSRYPKWILDHPFLSEVKEYRKIFQDIGLSNTFEPLTKSLAEDAAKSFIKDLSLTDFCYNQPYLDDDLSEAIRLFFANIKTQNYIDIKKENKISLYLAEDIILSSGEVFVKRGISLFSLLEKFQTRINKDFFSLQSFKDFGRLNVPLTSANIRFSTDPWDIATMSMRGIRTCLSWSGERRQCLIGSMIDPFSGVIFLESAGKQTEYGSKMLYRANVRCAIKVDKGLDKRVPIILIDKIYPECHFEVLSLFKQFLESKTKYQVYYSPHIKTPIENGFIVSPKSQLKDKLRHCSELDKSFFEFETNLSIDSYQDIPLKNSSFNFDLL